MHTQCECEGEGWTQCEREGWMQCEGEGGEDTQSEGGGEGRGGGRGVNPQVARTLGSGWLSGAHREAENAPAELPDSLETLLPQE